MREGQLNFGDNKFFATIAEGQACVYAEKGGKISNATILKMELRNPFDQSAMGTRYFVNAALFKSFFITNSLQLLPSGQFKVE
jgi:hypothetical protein